MEKKYTITISVLILVLIGFGIYIFKPERITSFEACSKKYPVMESYPRVCMTKSGERFVEDIGNVLEKENLIRIASPRPQERITSPLVVTGEARGTWFFEATFPLKLTTKDGKVLVNSYAEAQGEWMTEEFVPFRATITFEKGTETEGILILEKQNASGDPEMSDELRVPVKF